MRRQSQHGARDRFVREAEDEKQSQEGQGKDIAKIAQRQHCDLCTHAMGEQAVCFLESYPTAEIMVWRERFVCGQEGVGHPALIGDCRMGWE